MSETKSASSLLVKALALLVFSLGVLAIVGTLILWRAGDIDLPTLLSSLVAISLLFYLGIRAIISVTRSPKNR